MKKIDLEIPYGKSSLAFSLPAKRLIGVLEPDAPAEKDIKGLLADSLDREPNTSRLKGILSGKKSILIVVTDATRNAHLKKIVPEVLKRIDDGIVKIDIMIATGMHKKHTKDQLKELLGEGVLKRYNVLNHEQDKRFLTNLGSTRMGIPIVLDARLKDYGSVISIGVVEPHLYAGYSGGAKTVAIGLAGEETISATHSVRFLDDPGTTIGSVIGNPFQDTLWEIAERVRLAFSINIVNDLNGRAIAVFSGNTKKVFEEGVLFAKKIFEVQVKEAADIVICGIGYPKDINLYQASRAINYITSVDKPILKKGGVLMIAAELEGGVGGSAAEERFYARLKDMRSPEDFLKTVKKSGCLAGEHRAYMVAKGLLDYDIIFVTKDRGGLMSGLPFESFRNIDDALQRADNLTGKECGIYAAVTNSSFLFWTFGNFSCHSTIIVTRRAVILFSRVTSSAA